MNSDFDESTETSSIDHCCDAADEKYKELYKSAVGGVVVNTIHRNVPTYWIG